MRSLATIQVTREDGSEVVFKRKFAEGGQGMVFLVAEEGHASILAKVYKEPSEDRANRLRELLVRRNERVERVTAWPSGLLYDEQRRPIGFEMPYISNAHPLFNAYQIRSRLAKFPGRDYRFLVRAARNLAAALHHVHDAGLVVGDLNESNVLVDGEAMVRLIDTDSYQIEVNGRILTCDVGKSELLAPELQGRSLSKLIRTPDHDCFSLAVLVFHLLVLGRHPFAGIPKGKDEISLESAISEGWYPYDSAKGGPLLPPPGLDLEWLPTSVRELFACAFDPTRAGHRPTAQEWFSALKDMEADLVTCGDNGRHLYPGHNGECPWCSLEAQWRVMLFGVSCGTERPERDYGDENFDVDAIWAEINSIPPPVVRPLPEVPPIAYIEPAAVDRFQKFINFLPYVILFAFVAIAAWNKLPALLVFALVFTYVRLCSKDKFCFSPTARRARKSYQDLKVELEDVAKDWTQDVQSDQFAKTLAQLAAIREQYVDNSRYEHLKQLALGRERGQELLAYLGRFPITTADVISLSNAQAFHLDNVGIHTAAQVTPESLERHCPPEQRDDLLRWRRSLEIHFWNTTAYSLSHSSELAIRQVLAKERRNMREALERGPARLREIKAAIVETDQELRDRLATLVPHYMEAASVHKAYNGL